MVLFTLRWKLKSKNNNTKGKRIRLTEKKLKRKFSLGT